MVLTSVNLTLILSVITSTGIQSGVRNDLKPAREVKQFFVFRATLSHLMEPGSRAERKKEFSYA
jgi:hypothetical protein